MNAASVKSLLNSYISLNIKPRREEEKRKVNTHAWRDVNIQVHVATPSVSFGN